MFINVWAVENFGLRASRGHGPWQGAFNAGMENHIAPVVAAANAGSFDRVRPAPHFAPDDRRWNAQIARGQNRDLELAA
jgi:hypothetical protein